MREVVHWRVTDLLEQALALHKQGHGLGARILLRSALETLVVLIYLNQQMTNVLDGKLSFFKFDTVTTKLVLGSKDDSTGIGAVHIMDVIRSSSKKYDFIEEMYGALSESAHPNYEGMSAGYTRIDHKADTVEFCDRWMERYGTGFPHYVMLCLKIFHHEYNEVWCAQFEQLEKWLEANDTQLEAERAAAKENEAAVAKVP